jgi:flagellar hook-associated protein 2
VISPSVEGLESATIFNGTLDGNSTLARLGGIQNGDTNVFNNNNTIGEIFNFDFSGANADGVANFTIGNYSVNLREDMTMQQMITAVNEVSSSTGVTMRFDNNSNNRLTLESTTSGYSGRINDVGALGTALGMNIVDNTVENTGTDARITIGGTTEIVRSTNNFSIDGMSFDLSGINPASFASGPLELSVNVAQNTERVRETITSFVEEYNNLVRELAALRNTARPTTGGSFFDPLTDEQRRAMSESEIANWEEQAQQGMLHRSQIIERTLSDMRRAINSAGVADVTEGTGAAIL